MSVYGPTVASRDGKISSSVPTRNFGVSTTILGSTNEKALYWWDLAGVGAGATVNSASMVVYQAGSAAANAFVLTVYAIKAANWEWIEGTRNNAQALSGEPCWDARVANGSGGVTNAWAGSAGLSTSGTDYDATALGTANGNRSDVNGTAYTISLNTTAVAAMLNNAANYGILLVTSSGCGAIASKDNATAGYRPTLTIDYTAASGLAIPVLMMQYRQRKN